VYMGAEHGAFHPAAILTWRTSRGLFPDIWITSYCY
jgi:hypothetical protein